MSKFFINRPIVAIVIAIFTVIVGAVTVAQLAGRAIPADRAARGAGHGHLRRRGRPDDRAIRGHADRAADERRRQHELHVLAECDGEWPDEDDRRFRRRHRSEHRPDPRAEPRDASRVAASRRSEQLWRDRAEIGDRAADAGVALFAQGNARCAVSWPTTRTSICTTSFCASGASAQSRSLEQANTPCGCG